MSFFYEIDTSNSVHRDNHTFELEFDYTNADPHRPIPETLIRGLKRELAVGDTKLGEAKQDDNVVRKDDLDEDTKEARGFMVLGMHRSGTSLLTGLLVEGFGYNPGGPLIPPSQHNTKGYYELIPAVQQNDEWMKDQGITHKDVEKHDVERALEATKNKTVSTEYLNHTLALLNDPTSLVPWLQKDPRMCITMRTWLPYLTSTKPAILFTYRHPLDVAKSLKKRDRTPLAKGLKLWIQFNQAALQNSDDLCRVTTSNHAVMADPLGETLRIVRDLKSICHVSAPPKVITKNITNEFVDPALQHGLDKMKKENKRLLAMHGSCEVHDYDSKIEGAAKEEEMEAYLMAMKMYCAFERGNFKRVDF